MIAAVRSLEVWMDLKANPFHVLANYRILNAGMPMSRALYLQMKLQANWYMCYDSPLGCNYSLGYNYLLIVTLFLIQVYFPGDQNSVGYLQRSLYHWIPNNCYMTRVTIFVTKPQSLNIILAYFHLIDDLTVKWKFTLKHCFISKEIIWTNLVHKSFQHDLHDFNFSDPCYFL